MLSQRSRRHDKCLWRTLREYALISRNGEESLKKLLSTYPDPARFGGEPKHGSNTCCVKTSSPFAPEDRVKTVT